MISCYLLDIPSKESQIIDVRKYDVGLLLSLQSMAFPVVEFSKEGYKIRKVFG